MAPSAKKKISMRTVFRSVGMSSCYVACCRNSMRDLQKAWAAIESWREKQSYSQGKAVFCDERNALIAIAFGCCPTGMIVRVGNQRSRGTLERCGTDVRITLTSPAPVSTTKRKF